MWPLVAKINNKNNTIIKMVIIKRVARRQSTREEKRYRTIKEIIKLGNKPSRPRIVSYVAMISRSSIRLLPTGNLGCSTQNAANQKHL